MTIRGRLLGLAASLWLGFFVSACASPPLPTGLACQGYGCDASGNVAQMQQPASDAAGTTETAGTTGAGGDTGAAGTTATAGAVGDTGAGGATGAAAATGVAGDTGVAGVTGTAGANGTAGTTDTGGATGTAGTIGAAGAGGSTGAGGAVACTPGPITGAGGGTGDACANTSWTFTPSNVCDPATNPSCNFQASARDPANAIDGDPFTRYTSGQTQAGGENFVLSFAAPVSITGITIDSGGNSPTDFAVSYVVEYSLDGTMFIGWCPALAGPGSPLLDIVFPARITVKALRVTQTGMQPAGNPSWWSIFELTLDGCTRP